MSHPGLGVERGALAVAAGADYLATDDDAEFGSSVVGEGSSVGVYSVMDEVDTVFNRFSSP